MLDNVALGRLYGRKSARSRRAPEAEAMEVLALVGLAAEAARVCLDATQQVGRRATDLLVSTRSASISRCPP